MKQPHWLASTSGVPCTSVQTHALSRQVAGCATWSQMEFGPDPPKWQKFGFGPTQPSGPTAASPELSRAPSLGSPVDEASSVAGSSIDWASREPPSDRELASEPHATARQEISDHARAAELIAPDDAPLARRGKARWTEDSWWVRARPHAGGAVVMTHKRKTPRRRSMTAGDRPSAWIDEKDGVSST